MNFRSLISSLVWFAVTAGISSTAPAEILYVGDNNDTVRRYDAQTGKFLDDPPQALLQRACLSPRVSAGCPGRGA